MKKILNDQSRWMPILFLGLCVGTYGVYLSQLGFYWDDWMTIYLTEKYERAADFLYYAYRPLFAWLDVIIRSILGLKPLYWQIVFLVIRWLTIWSMWGVMVRLWPRHREQMAWAAILFSVYPTFFTQSLAVNYKSQFFSFLLFLLSIILMIQAYRNRKTRWPYTILGMLFTLGHLLTTEYMAGLEITRPVILFLIISSQVDDWKERIKRILINWSPYLLMIFLFVGRRMIFFPGEVDPNPFIDLESGGNLFGTLLDVVIISLRDVWYVLVTSWSGIIQPEEIIVISPGILLAWAIALVVSLAVYFVIRAANQQAIEEKNHGWEKQAIFLGMFSVFVGLLPIWLTGRKILSGGFADRYGIPAMFGASLVVVALLSLLISNRDYRRIVFTVLLGFSIAAQIRASNEFRWDWVRQTRAYWQMYWRAPAIEPNTAIISDGAFTGTTNRYNAAFAMNLLYPQIEGTDLATYWYFEIPYNGLHRYIPEMLEGMTLTGEFYNEKFIGDSKDSILIITPEPEDQCLWFLTPRDVKNNAILEQASQLSAIVNLDRIHREPVSDDYPMEDIFGPEPKHGWCYYFQKASLAHQFEDWEEVIRLWDEAEQLGYQTAYIYELIPFIEAFGYIGDWDQAGKISKDSYEKGLHKNLMLCASWKHMQESFAGNEDFDLAYDEVSQTLNCE